MKKDSFPEFSGETGALLQYIVVPPEEEILPHPYLLFAAPDDKPVKKLLIIR